MTGLNLYISFSNKCKFVRSYQFLFAFWLKEGRNHKNIIVVILTVDRIFFFGTEGGIYKLPSQGAKWTKKEIKKRRFFFFTKTMFHTCFIFRHHLFMQLCCSFFPLAEKNSKGQFSILKTLLKCSRLYHKLKRARKKGEISRCGVYTDTKTSLILAHIFIYYTLLIHVTHKSHIKVYINIYIVTRIVVFI